MVNTMDQSNAIVYCVCYVVCQHCQHKDQSTQCIEWYVCQHCWRHWCLWLLHKHCIQSNEVWKLYSTLYTVVSCPCQEGRLFAIWKVFHLGGLAVHQSVWGGSFVNFLGLVKSTRVIAGKMHSQSPILKVRGAQQPSNSYISMGTKLHPPYPNQMPAWYMNLDLKGAVQCLKNVGL